MWHFIDPLGGILSGWDHRSAAFLVPAANHCSQGHSSTVGACWRWSFELWFTGCRVFSSVILSPICLRQVFKIIAQLSGNVTIYFDQLTATDIYERVRILSAVSDLSLRVTADVLQSDIPKWGIASSLLLWPCGRGDRWSSHDRNKNPCCLLYGAEPFTSSYQC